VPVRLTRRAGAIVAVVVALVLTAAVSCSRNDTLLQVNGWTLTRTDFLDELDQIAHNQGYLDARSQNGQSFKVFKEGSTTDYDPSFVAEMLNERVTFQLAGAEVAKRHLTVTDADRAKAIAVIDQGLATGANPAGSAGVTGGTTPAGTTPAATTPGATGTTPGSTPGTSVLDHFGSYRDVLVDGVANLQVLQAALTPQDTSDAGLQKVYDQTKDQIATQACVNHILVQAGTGAVDPTTGQLVPPTDAEYATALAKATALQALITKGTDFAAVAKASSDDTSTKASGGDLGCNPKGQFTGDFEAAVWSQPVGVVGAPVKSDFGYHLILVRDRRLFSFAELKDKILGAVQDQAQQGLQTWLDQASKSAQVVVDPQAGTWDAATGTIKPSGSTPTVSLAPNDTTPTSGTGIQDGVPRADSSPTVVPEAPTTGAPAAGPAPAGPTTVAPTTSAR
jgi:hypothetical protein